MSNKIYIEHTCSDILIPQHISVIGLYTCQIMLLNATVTYLYHYHLLAALEFCLYITSTLLWRKIKHQSIERTADIICLTINLSYATYTSFLLPRFYTFVWLSSLFAAGTIFTQNELLFYFQVKQYYNITIENQNQTQKFHYFSMEYTNPNTHSREMAYYRNVITHAIGLHIGLCISSLYCIIHNPNSFCN